MTIRKERAEDGQWADEQEEEMQEIVAQVPDLNLLLWFDLSPQTPRVWAEQPAEWWMPATAYQHAYREGQEIEQQSNAAAQAAKKDT